jgi:antitoxin MazE
MAGKRWGRTLVERRRWIYIVYPKEQMMVARIRKWGNSAAVRLPTAALATAGLSLDDQIDVVAREGVVELRRMRRTLTVEELFAEARKKGPLEPPAVVDWGPDRGAEILPDDDWSDIAPRD